MFERRNFLIGSAALLVTACTGSSNAKMSMVDATALVADLPDNLAKRVSLAIMENPNTKPRIDHHGFPAWTWRDGNGDHGYGGCVHIHPETGLPYLETQFPKHIRPETPMSPKGRNPQKYILFGVTGEWLARVHHMFPVEWEENWPSPKAHEDGEKLLRDLARLLGVIE